MERETLNKVIQAIAHEDAECPQGNPFLDLVGSFAANMASQAIA